MARDNSDQSVQLKEYKVLKRIFQADVGFHEPGGTVKMTPDQAQVLLRLNALKEVKDNGKRGFDSKRN